MCREQAEELLRRGWPGGAEARYDAGAAAVLCRMRRFTPGLLFLYDRMRLHREVLQVRLSSTRPGPASTCPGPAQPALGPPQPCPPTLPWTCLNHFHVCIIMQTLRLQHGVRHAKTGTSQLDKPCIKSSMPGQALAVKQCGLAHLVPKLEQALLD